MQCRPNNKSFVLSISFSNYLTEKSGVPKVILSQSALFCENNISYIGIFSVKKTFINDDVFVFCKYGLIVDNRFIGVFQMNEIINYLVDLANEKYTLMCFHIHHLLYNKLNLVQSLIDTFNEVPIIQYLHDYYLCCSNYNLMRNGEIFCGGKGISSEMCANCKFFSESVKRTVKIKHFLKKYVNRTIFISPSEITKRIFGNFYPEYAEKVIVLPHQKYLGEYSENREDLDVNARIRIGFLAMPNKHKGWEQYKKLVSKYSQYDFFIFNSSNEEYDNINKCKISFTPESNGMINALREHKIDVAFLWSLCAETYSFTFDEAYSSNCFIITNQNSGNIKDSVYKHKNGVVLKSEKDLFELFDNEKKFRYMINKFREETAPGPKYCAINDRIINLTKSIGKNYPSENCKKQIKIRNWPLLFILNRIYKEKKT